MSFRLLATLLCVVLLAAPPLTALDIQEVWPDDTRHQGFGEPVFGDLDGDGDLDVVLVHHGEGVFVWRNDGGNAWTEMTPGFFTEVADPHGAALGDYDDDGDLDIFVSIGGGLGKLLGEKEDPLFRNDGGFQFTDVTTEAGTDNTDGRGRSPLWFDHDGDGDLDLLIQNLQTPHLLLRNDGGTFTDITAGSGLEGVHEKLVIRHPVDHDMDGDMDLILGGAVPDVYLENRNGVFVDRTDSVGLGESAYASSFVMADFDRDGDLDLFIARNWSDKKRWVHWDEERIAFTDKRKNVAPGIDFDATGSLRFVLYGNSDPAAGFIFLGAGKKKVNQHDFVLDPSDPDLSGAPSIDPQASTPGYYIWRQGGRWHLRWNEGKIGPYVYGEVHAVDGAVQGVDKVGIPAPIIPQVRDTLYLNDGGVFRDVTDAVGIPSRVMDRTPGAAWADFDSDGWPDLYIVRAGLRVEGDAPDLLLRNPGDGTIENLSHLIPTGRQGAEVGNGEAAATPDVNGDGRPDLFVKWGHAEPEPGKGRDRLFLNPVGGRKILVELVATESNPQAFGTKVLVEAGPHRQLQEYWGFAGGSSYSQGAAQPLHFGLGGADRADVTVTWPRGFVQTVTDVSAGTRLVIEERGSVTTMPVDTSGGIPRFDPRDADALPEETTPQSGEVLR